MIDLCTTLSHKNLMWYIEYILVLPSLHQNIFGEITFNIETLWLQTLGAYVHDSAIIIP